MAVQIQFRRDTSANWASANPVLAEGELGINTTTNQFKIGNGSTAWNSLAYAPLSGTVADLDDITNVVITSAANGDLLKWNGSAWVNASGYALLASPTFTGTVVLPDNTVALGTKTTGDYVATITGGTGVSSTAATTGEGTTHSLSIGQAVATTDNVTFAGVTADAIKVGVTAANEIDTTSGGLTIDSAGGTVTIDDNLTVTGNLTVSGSTTSVNTETLTVDDNIIVLNNNVTSAPTENAGIEVERGSSTNVVLRWNETSDKWELTNDGTTFADIATESYAASLTPATLDAIGDVTITTATNGQFLKWNGSAWVNDTIPAINNIDDISGVTITAAANKDFLMYNGTAWVDQPITLGTDTSGNYMTDVSAGTGISVTHTPGEGSTATIGLNAGIDALSDVTITSVATSQLLQYNGSAWVNATVSTSPTWEDENNIIAGRVFQ